MILHKSLGYNKAILDVKKEMKIFLFLYLFTCKTRKNFPNVYELFKFLVKTRKNNLNL